MNKEIIMIEELRKYFEFSGTISGTQYFLRNLVSSIAAFTAGGVIGVGVVLNIKLQMSLKKSMLN